MVAWLSAACIPHSRHHPFASSVGARSMCPQKHRLSSLDTLCVVCIRSSFLSSLCLVMRLPLEQENFQAEYPHDGKAHACQESRALGALAVEQADQDHDGEDECNGDDFADELIHGASAILRKRLFPLTRARLTRRAWLTFRSAASCASRR